MTPSVVALAAAAILGMIVCLSSAFAEEHPAIEIVMFVAIYAALITLTVVAILSAIGITGWVL